jgi:hypothetical protein
MLPGALDRRLQESVRIRLFASVAQGRAEAMIAARELTWYDFIELRMYQLESIPRKR